MYAAALVLLSSPAVLAQTQHEIIAPRVAKPSAATRLQELEASIAELKAGREDAPEGMKSMVDKQVESLKEAIKMQKMVDEANEKNKAMRPKLSDDAKAFFTPVAVAKVPTWIPDTVTRSEVTDEMLKCPAGAKVYGGKKDEDPECRLPPETRGGIPKPHGLALWFYKSTGRLKAQRYYENGLLRWSISYHHTGGRDTEGFYDNVKPKQDRYTGLHTSYAPNGTIVRQAEYKEGVLQGWSKLWEDDGFPMSAARYENGKNVEMVGPNRQKM